jgi:hypothetical protein
MISESLLNKDVLIISFNEKNENYNDSNILQIIEKIKEIKPLCLIICTQESGQKIINARKHIQYILNKKLNENYYFLLNKSDISNIKKFKFQSTPRTRVYINFNKSINNKDKIKKIIIKNYTENGKTLEIICENNTIKRNNDYIIKTQIDFIYTNTNDKSTKINKINIFNLDLENNKNQNIHEFTELFDKSVFCNTFYCFKNKKYSHFL